MAKILLLDSSLKHGQIYVQPFLKRLEVYLEDKSDCVDVRNITTFDERAFFEYDQVIFIFFVSMNSIPSSTLEIFSKLENQPKKHTEVYALIACDEYEPEKCNLAKQIMENWCNREKLSFKGCLKIGSALFIMKTPSKFIVCNYLKNFAQAILKHSQISSQVTMLTDGLFMKKANKYWNKEIKKVHKQKKKRF